jgi:hypothetical protein
MASGEAGCAPQILGQANAEPGYPARNGTGEPVIGCRKIRGAMRDANNCAAQSARSYNENKHT